MKIRWFAENNITGEKVNVTALADDIDSKMPEYELYDYACDVMWPDTPKDKINVYGEEV